MVSYSAKLDRRTKQHTQYGVSVSNGSRNMARTKVAEKKGEKNEHGQNYIASPTGIANYPGNSWLPAKGFEPLLPGIGQEAKPPGIIPGTAGSPLRVWAAPPWYWTGCYTTWNYPGNSWLPAKGLSRSSLVLDRTLHHLERDRFLVALYGTEERSPELWSNRTWWEAD